MPLISTHGQRIFFAHIPKTAGSSVEEYLVRRFGGPLSLIDRNKREGVRGTGLITPLTHVAAIDLREMLPPDIDFSFTVVRNPVTRIQSEYRYQTGVSRLSRLGFSTWLRVMIAAARIEPRIYENHIRPQVDLIPENSEIFRLEDGFDALIERLDEVTGSTAPDQAVRHLLKRERKDIALHRQDVELLGAFYADDFERFGYDLPDPSAYPHDRHASARAAFAACLAHALVMRQRHDWTRGA